jgi:hypothetical protein
MHIFIDESGSFLPPATKPHSHSLVLALIVPTRNHEPLCYEFLRLRDTWPNNAIEVKGSALSELETAQIAKLLADHDTLVEFKAIDMAIHPTEIINDFKQYQAAAITANITSQHQPTMICQSEDLAETFRSMSNQLFVQAMLTIPVIIDSVQDGTLYHAQRTPEELGRFAWTIDRKDHDMTAMERAWTTLILPAGEAKSTTTPFVRLIGADYSHFAKYEVTEANADPETVRHMKWMQETYEIGTESGASRYHNWKLLLTEERAFADSKDDLGLQLADITATTFRRAFNNHLQPEGWEPFGELLTHKSVPPFVMLGKPGSTKRQVDDYTTRVWQRLDSRAKNMLLDD